MRRRSLVAVLLIVAAGLAGLVLRTRPAARHELAPGIAGSPSLAARRQGVLLSDRGEAHAARSRPDASSTPGVSVSTIARVRGIVWSAAGVRVPDVPVSALVPGVFGSHETRTAGDGSFDFADLTPGPWSIAAWDALGHIGVVAVTLVAGDNDDVAVHFVAGREISGTVVFEGNGVPGAIVELNRCHPTDPALVIAVEARNAAWENLGQSPFSDGRGFRREAATSADGHFLFREVESAICSLDAEKLEIGRAIRRPGVSPGTEGIVMTLERGGDLHGRLLDEDGKPFEPEGMVVANGRRAGANVFQAFAEIEHGKYEFRQLPPGEYRISAPLFHQAGPPPADLDLAAGETKTFDLRLPWTSTVRGRVIDAEDGKPLGASISLVTIRLKQEEISWYAPLGSCDAAGRFEIAHVGDAMTIEIQAAGYVSISLGLPVRDRSTLDLHDIALAPDP